MADPRDSLLLLTLQLAIPLRIAELLALDVDDRAHVMEVWRRDALMPIAERGDVLQFRAQAKRGQAADGFNHLARALASLSFHPGGVRFAGRHWCAIAHHHDVPDVITGMSCDEAAYAAEDQVVPARAVRTVTTKGGLL